MINRPRIVKNPKRSHQSARAAQRSPLLPDVDLFLRAVFRINDFSGCRDL